MSQRETNLLWLKDLLDQVAARRRQLEWAEDETTAHLLTEAMLRDLESCRRLCEQLRRRGRFEQVA
ncbi:MAG TPA: hypothetical protein VJ739_16800 [Gemmataceae bacterium]|nr:hypothetical protein [Gemmataceae bacterium]